jgi:hypothetical protein
VHPYVRGLAGSEPEVIDEEVVLGLREERRSKQGGEKRSANAPIITLLPPGEGGRSGVWAPAR